MKQKILFIVLVIIMRLKKTYYVQLGRVEVSYRPEDREWNPSCMDILFSWDYLARVDYSRYYLDQLPVGRANTILKRAIRRLLA